MSLTPSEARAIGIEKSTLHHLRRKAASKRSLRVYQKVRKKLRSNFEVASELCTST